MEIFVLVPVEKNADIIVILDLRMRQQCSETDCGVHQDEQPENVHGESLKD